MRALRAPGVDIATIQVHGFCPWSPFAIGAALNNGTPPSEYPGDFVIHASGLEGDDSFEVLITSVLCCRNYFHATHAVSGEFIHGADVFDVTKRAGQRWNWNWRALTELAVAEFVTGNQSLNVPVRKIPPAALAIVKNGHVEWHLEPYWGGVFSKRSASTLASGLAALRRTFDQIPPTPAALSLSGGLDSRMILAELLRAGHRPLTGTMGFPDSGDMLAAKAIARRFGLEHRDVALHPNDYLRRALEITRTTAGLKTANHWHTFIYMNAVNFPQDHLHYVGSNGEFARTPWFDYYPAALIYDRMPVLLDQRIIGQRFSHGPYQRRFAKAKSSTPWLDAQRAEVDDLPGRFAAMCAGEGTALDRLDRFIELNPVRNFIGTGVSIYSYHLPTFSPFLDALWIKEAASLKRADKLGSRFHRYAIAQSCPDLLAFSMGDGKPLGRWPQWSFRPQKRPQKPYSNFDAVRRLEEVEALTRSSKHLIELFGDEMLMDEDFRAVFGGLLLATHFTAECAKEHGLL